MDHCFVNQMRSHNPQQNTARTRRYVRCPLIAQSLLRQVQVHRKSRRRRTPSIVLKIYILVPYLHLIWFKGWVMTNKLPYEINLM